MKINVDAGHGSYVAGKRTPPMPFDIDVNEDGITDIKKGDQYREHYANVGVAKFLVQELMRCGFQTTKSGWDDDNAYDDSDMALSSRQAIVVSNKCEYSVSIHFNAYGDGKSFNSAEGVGIYIHDKYAEQSEKFAKVILRYLTRGTKQRNRGIKKQALAMCNCNSLNTKAAIICELAFMTNKREATKLMASEAFWEESAKEICKGICEYTGVKYIEKKEDSMPTKTITTKSSKEDIKWLQTNLNTCLSTTESFIPLAIDGSYGPRTRIAVLIYWERLTWGRHMKDNGKRAGKATRKALASEKKK